VKWVLLIFAGTLILDGLAFGLLRPGFLVFPFGFLALLLFIVFRGR